MGNRGAESDWPYQGAIDVAASFGANMEAMVSSEKGYLKQFCEPGMIYSVSDPNYFKHVKKLLENTSVIIHQKVNQPTAFTFKETFHCTVFSVLFNLRRIQIDYLSFFSSGTNNSGSRK